MLLVAASGLSAGRHAVTCALLQRRLLMAAGVGAWPEDATVVLGDEDVVDAGLPASHEPVSVEFPELVAVASPPLAVRVVAFVLESHGDSVVLEAPEVFAQRVVELALPFRGEECDDLGAAADERVSVAPNGVFGVGKSYAFGVAVFQASSAAWTFWAAVSVENGGSGGRL